MVKKDQLSERLNEKLDTDLDWSKMKKEDLEHLEMMVDEGLLIEPIIKNQIKEKGTSKFEKFMDDWEPGQLITSSDL